MSTILQKMPRVVRDLANEHAKNVDLVLEGEETEADKNIIELLSEPLIHLVRNSIGHGIEATAVRHSLEKPSVGKLTIRAWQESDDLYLEISDDGRGIDPETVKRKILAMGLADEETLADMDPQDIIQYIFAAGLSTAENVSGLSGRGVGMDVVRSSVEHLGGKVQVHSRFGEGTSTTLTLPLSISVSKVMTFTLCGQMLAVPINIVAATKRVPKAAIQRIKHYDTFLWRRKTVPLVSLADILEFSGQREETAYVSVLIVRHYNDFVGLVVDEFQGGVDVILKPLEGVLAHLQCYEGSALLGDGSVLLLLNLKGLL
ncbi:MAG: hypothetical protein D3910_17420 [Candidatus Electrothrix sp. ATG2]|nr:hypothetical protein [Candidatus Electrothrix sp. ATG2]